MRANTRQNLRRWLHRAARIRLSTVLLIGGALLLAYVAWSYASMYLMQRELAREWQRQNASASAPVVPAYNDLTRIVIPSINLDAIVVTGTSHRQLLLGPGWLQDTARPGEVGNAVISAHRDTFFRHIVELKKGDAVQVSRGGRTYNYEVTGKKIVSPDDVSVLKQSSDRELTLITCYPTYYIGPAPERLVVFTRSVDEPGAQAKSQGETKDRP